MIERRTITSREDWLAWRKVDVTASVIGALFGAHPKATALRLYSEKRGTEFLESDDKVRRRGRWLEPAVAKAVGEKRPDWQLTAPHLYLRDSHLRLGATPDFLISDTDGRRGVLEAKTVAPDIYHKHWASGREPPLWVTLQCLTGMMLDDADFGAVAVLLVDPYEMECEILDVPRNPAAEEKIVEAVQSFWRAVASGDEPTPDFARDAEVIAAMRRHVTPGKPIDFAGNNALPDMLDERAVLKERIKVAEDRCEAIEAEVKFLMGDAEVVTGLPGWQVTFKDVDYKGYEVPARTRRTLRIKDKRA